MDRCALEFIPAGRAFCNQGIAGNKMRLLAVVLKRVGRADVLQPEDRIRFEQLVLPHLDSAMNVAGWLLRNRSDAEDVVQEALLRAYRFFDHFRGGEARAWLLRIVRNSCYSWLEKNRPTELMTEFDEESHCRPAPTPETLAVQADERRTLMQALESLPPRSREVIVLRELDDCSYKEIAEITGIPIGTVMSTLSRARERLHRILTSAASKEAP